MKQPWSLLGLRSRSRRSPLVRKPGRQRHPRRRRAATRSRHPDLLAVARPRRRLIGGAVFATSRNLTCGVTAGVTCHVLSGVGPQGLPAGTAVGEPARAPPGRSAKRVRSSVGDRRERADDRHRRRVRRSQPRVRPRRVPREVRASAVHQRQRLLREGRPRFVGSLLGGNQGWGQEASIDTQIASAVCPNCKLVVVEASSDSPAALLAAARTAVAHGATVVSNSYSMNESAGEDDASYAIGVPFVFGAGDSGAARNGPLRPRT